MNKHIRSAGIEYFTTPKNGHYGGWWCWNLHHHQSQTRE